MVAEILQRIEEILRTADDDPARARREIDGLAAILESHFRWEERAIVAALDGLDGPRADARGPVRLSATSWSVALALAGARAAGAFFFAGADARFSASSSMACSRVIDSGVRSRGRVRLVTPSVT